MKCSHILKQLSLSLNIRKPIRMPALYTKLLPFMILLTILKSFHDINPHLIMHAITIRRIFGMLASTDRVKCLAVIWDDPSNWFKWRIFVGSITPDRIKGTGNTMVLSWKDRMHTKI
jgi:hypothetical protein